MTVLDEIAGERRRQVEVEGWTAEHDDGHDFGDLAAAAGCYAINADPEGWRSNDHHFDEAGHATSPSYWPWDAAWWKPSTPRRDMVKAAALLVAAIERHDRQSGVAAPAPSVKAPAADLPRLPSAYAWLTAVTGKPRHLIEALKLFGVVETPGKANTVEIIGWADEVGLKAVYPHDSIAWCGLFAAVAVKRAGWTPVKDPLWARNWANFGRRVDDDESYGLGDVLVFARAGGFGHVGFYVGEDADCFHVLGGNQSDKVCIIRIEKTRLLQARRPKWRFAQPAGVKPFHLSAKGVVSENEA